MNNTSDIQDRYVFTYVSLINIQHWEITEMMLPYCISKFWLSNEQKVQNKVVHTNVSLFNAYTFTKVIMTLCLL